MTEPVKSECDFSLEDSILGSGIPLEAILCTDELHRRPSRPPDYEKENLALVKLASALADSPSTIFQTLAETILDITQCDSAGLSLLTNDGNTPDVCGKRFYWPAIAGKWSPHVGGGTPRHFGPCGDVLDQNCTLLFRHFERRYPYLLPVNPAAEECLLVPFYVAGIAVGTIWAIMHSDRRKFDTEDDRVMASLGKFASSAYQALIRIEDLKFQEALRRQAGVRADVSAALAKAGHVREMLLGCVEAIVKNLDAAFARIWTLNKDENMLELQASAGMYTRLDGAYSRIRVGALKVGGIARERKPHLTNDVLNDPRVSDKDWARACGFVSFAGYPLLVEERVVGVMGLFARHPLSHATLETLASVADAIAQGIERKRAEEKLRQDERELRRITDAIPHFIFVLGSDGKVLYANQLVLEYSGLSSEDVSKDDFRTRIFHPDDIERVRDRRQHALELGAPFELEQRARRKDGRYRWFLIRYNPLHDEHGDVVRWYGTGTDIEDRKRAEERIRNENMALREEIDRTSMFEEIVGSSEPLRKVLQQVTKVAPVDSTVLILGETGTGKELIARAIHKRSPRSSRAFIRVNCAAIPSSLIASELFGHEKGAFTGALQRRLGRFESANGGTIFLDEIGELPAETQIALLRVLQEREIERVGGSQPIFVDVRVVAATNRDLKAAVAAGSFREDFFYRLNVFPIQIPSLRERVEDIPLLVEYLIERYAKKAGKKIRQIRKQTVELFQAYDWPGNIRELQNVIERAVVLCDGETFSVDETWLKGERDRQAGPAVPLAASIAEREREMIVAALTQSRGQVSGPTGAAAKLGIARQTLDSKIKSLGIDKHRFTSRST
jgi:formate hydrogenlyase transcriptional activator